MSFSPNFENVVLAIHIASVVLAFGVMSAYPLLTAAGNNIVDAGILPAFHRTQALIIRRFVSPGVVVVAASGLVLAFKTGTLKTFYVEWGVLATVALGGIAEGYLAPRQAQLAELAARDARVGEGKRSGEYDGLSRLVKRAGAIGSVIVLATILIMTAHD